MTLSSNHHPALSLCMSMSFLAKTGSHPRVKARGQAFAGHAPTGQLQANAALEKSVPTAVKDCGRCCGYVWKAGQTSSNIEPIVAGQVPERCLGSGAEMLDDLRRGQGSEPCGRSVV